MSTWKITGPPRFFEGVGMVYPVTKGGSRFNAAEEDELKALLAGWISVEDRMPANGQTVIVTDGEKTGSLMRLRLKWFVYGSNIPCSDLVTHWMPLPAPPAN
ncbi:DUF551 domain-containing protein [Oceanisphaera sp.]|uniref:DUF551 domain-containing protein n=1 Tax=Oceanisphaera sp. TaxID=1929979 RepID=UPI003A8FFDF4